MATMVGDAIRLLRKQRGWTQEELAQRSGFSQGTITNLEKNKRQNPSSDTVVRLSRAFGVDETEFLALAGRTEELLAAELAAVGRDDDAERILRLWPKLSRPARRMLLRAAMEYIEAAEEEAGNASPEDRN